MTTWEVGGREVDVSNLDKVLVPGPDLTKRDLIRHIERVADALLRNAGGRPLALKRHPDGIDEGGFFQKALPSHAPDWVGRVDVPLRGEDRTVTHLAAAGPADLVWAVNSGAIELHRWLSGADDIERPVELLIDLDPPKDAPVELVADAARWVRDLLDEWSVEPLLMTTGGSGYHVLVPLRGPATFAATSRIAARIGEILVERHGDVLTSAHRIRDRGGRVYVDLTRNTYGQTAIAPYSPRARPGAPVAVPIRWDELGRTPPDRFDVRSVARRLGQLDDVWADRDARSLTLEELEAAVGAGA